MLTKREVFIIPKGFHPNSALRKVFGKKHGSPVLERVKDKDGEIKEFRIIGNRFQRRFRQRNPYDQLPVRNEPQTFHGNRLDAKKMNWLGKIMQFFAQLLHKKAA